MFDADVRPRLDFRIYDGADTTGSRLLYESSSTVARDPHYFTTERFTVAGQAWTIAFFSSATFESDSGGMFVPYIFLGGLIVSFILFWLSRAQAGARMEAETINARLVSSEERYRSIVETAPDVIFSLAADGTITSLSPAFEALSGWPISRWVGESFVPIIHPEDLATAFLHFQEVLAGRSPQPYELRVLTASGAYLDVEFRTRPYIEEGAVTGAMGIARDITERKRAEVALRDSEARYRTFVEHSSEAIWRFELEQPVPVGAPLEEMLDGFYRWAYLAECNDAMARMYGYEVASQIVGARLGDMLVRSDQKNVDYLTAFIESGYRLVDAESVERDRHGVEKQFANNLIGIVEDGMLVRAWGMQRDITERRRAEAEVREAKEVAEAANRAKDQFLAVLSHELRTPLTPVLAALELLCEDTGIGADSRALVEMVDRNVKLEARLIDDLLDLTKIANGKLALNAETVDVHALVRAALDITGEDIRAKRLAVTTELNAAQHLVQGDPARLEQVFWNLVKNAVKFTPEGGAVRLRTLNEGRLLRVEVADTGIGIDPQFLPHIFNAFEQGEKTITRRYGGLGLGLAISKMLVDLHNGTISARSAGEGNGATFTVDLETVDALPLPQPARRSAASDGTTHRILLVDDHPDTTLVLKTLLERQAYHVTTATSVRSALETAKSQPFDLVISDIGLPDGTGLDIVRELSRSGPVKAIALSGFGMEEDIRRSLDAGFAEHLAKPVNFRTLHDAIRRLID
jgi:two-component system CheB/CheR fusion protein